MNERLSKLSEPFPAEAIDWRVGATNADKTKGIALAYLQARPVMDRLDEVVGPGNWTDTYTPILGANGPIGFICTLSLFVDGNWVSKSDGADTSDIEAIKGGISDAFKRAAVKWGVGRYLYDLPGIWIAIEARGKSFVLKEKPQLPAWALPKGETEPQTKPAQNTETPREKVDTHPAGNSSKRPLAPDKLKSYMAGKVKSSKPASDEEVDDVVDALTGFVKPESITTVIKYLFGANSLDDITPEQFSAMHAWLGLKNGIIEPLALDEIGSILSNPF